MIKSRRNPFHFQGGSTQWQPTSTLSTDQTDYSSSSSPVPDAYTMPTPHLHPRSRLTSSLFATTLVVSFMVVGLPHILPCPAPRVTFADGEIAPDGRRRRRRRPETSETDEGVIQVAGVPEGAASARAAKRECPVPKLGGVVGGLLGFEKSTPGSEPRPRLDNP